MTIDKDKRDILVKKYDLMKFADFDQPVFMTIDEFFDANNDEASIAPNLDRKLKVSEYYKTLKGLENKPTGDREGELTDLHKILKLDSTNTLALFNLGVTYGNLEQYKESIVAFNEAMKTKGGEHVTMDFVQNDFVPELGQHDVPTADIKLERGIVFYKADSVRKAYLDLTYCIENNHKLGDSYYYRGRTYLKADRLKEGCEDLKLAELNGMKEATDALNEVCR